MMAARLLSIAVLLLLLLLLFVQLLTLLLLLAKVRLGRARVVSLVRPMTVVATDSEGLLTAEMLLLLLMLLFRWMQLDALIDFGRTGLLTAA